jgi:hypothetical protein
LSSFIGDYVVEASYPEFFSGVPEGSRCEFRFALFAARPFGHAAKKYISFNALDPVSPQ